MSHFPTIRQIRHTVSRRVRDLWTGTLTTQALIAAQQIRDTSRVERQDYFQNMHLYLNTDGDGEEHRVIQSAPGALSLAGVLAATHAAATVYEIHRRHSVLDYNGFITDAVLSTGVEAVRADLSDSTMVLTANTNKPSGLEDEYALPDIGLKYIIEIRLEDSSSQFTIPVPLDQVQILPSSAGTKTLRFSPWAIAQGVVGRNVRILGMGEETEPATADSAVVYTDPDFIVVHVEDAVLNILAQGDGSVASWANARLRILAPLIELRREQLVSESRALPGSLVVPN